MTFNKPDGEHLLSMTNTESWLQNRSTKNIIQEQSELPENIKNLFLKILCTSEIVFIEATVYENTVTWFQTIKKSHQ